MLKQRILPLLDIIGIDTKYIKKLTDLGIDSAEELVALVATPGGQEKMAEYLGLDEDAFKSFVETAKKSLPKEIRDEMSKPSTLDVMFGARIPKQRQEFETQMAKHPEAPPKRSTSEFSDVVNKLKSITVPADVNLISKMPMVRNQGQRGTCVAFASVAVFEFLKGTSQDFSEQYLYWWCDKNDPVADVPGTTVKMGFTGLVEEGVCLEWTWRYNPKQIKGNEGQGPPSDAAKAEASKNKLEENLDLDENSISELKECLKGKDGFSERPITFSVPVYNSWLRSKAVELSGQITMPLPGESSEGGHAMVIVGYQEDASVPGGGFFIIRNSWGTVMEPYRSNTSVNTAGKRSLVPVNPPVGRASSQPQHMAHRMRQRCSSYAISETISLSPMRAAELLLSYMKGYIIRSALTLQKK